MKTDSYRQQLYALTNRILVHCPACGKQAAVTAPGMLRQDTGIKDTRLTCGHCGYHVSRKGITGTGQLLGAPVDPYFRQPLWLTRSCCGQCLWAYNAEHLALLQQHIGARLRERSGPGHINKSIGSRLPRWMTAAGNRQAVLQAIRELEKTLIPRSG